MKHSIEMKKGFTMVELLVVVSIMGILSTMGVASLHAAVVNNRVRDAAVNVTAYLERVASEANRFSDKVCVKIGNNGKTIYAVKGACPNSAGINKAISQLTLENALTFENATHKDCTNSWYNSDVTDTFEPKFGLSAAPVQGCIVVKYSGGEKKARALKKKEKNNIIPQVSYDRGNSWTDL
jgi:prepilin-type N-terminal cleavage/methylation domain